MSEVKAELKAKHGLKPQDVISNLTYLIDKGWIAEEKEERDFTTPRGATVSAEKKWYKITSPGIDRIEGSSAFREGGKFSGININAIGTNVVTLGDGNVVSTRFVAAGEALSALRASVLDAPLSEEEKLSVVADIEALQGQLAKPEPNPDVIKGIWSSLSKSADVGSLGQLVATVGTHLAPLLL